MNQSSQQQLQDFFCIASTQGCVNAWCDKFASCVVAAAVCVSLASTAPEQHT
jgi:hypothetical protein